MIQEDIQLGLSDPWWRICNLYWIVDKDGRPVPFKPNAEQADFSQQLHTRNAVLKGAVMTTRRLLKGNNLKHGIYRA